MRLKLQKTLKGLNVAAGAVNAAQFSWSLIAGTIHWFHGGQTHHTIPLTEEQRRHVANGGNLECEYACGTVLIARQ